MESSEEFYYNRIYYISLRILAMDISENPTFRVVYVFVKKIKNKKKVSNKIYTTLLIYPFNIIMSNYSTTINKHS